MSKKFKIANFYKSIVFWCKRGSDAISRPFTVNVFSLTESSLKIKTFHYLGGKSPIMVNTIASPGGVKFRGKTIDVSFKCYYDLCVHVNV